MTLSMSAYTDFEALPSEKKNPSLTRCHTRTLLNCGAPRATITNVALTAAVAKLAAAYHHAQDTGETTSVASVTTKTASSLAPLAVMLIFALTLKRSCA